jgi:hypothetical protein
MRNAVLTLMFSFAAAAVNAQGATATLPAIKPTPTSSIGTTTTTKKPNNTGEIFRWTDAKGGVQYGTEVPEEYRAKARKVDGSINIVKSPAPASVGQRAPAAQPESSQSAVRKPVTEREKCEAAWQEYQASQVCFNQFRRGVAGAGRGTGLLPEAQNKCKDVTEPAPCR